jgi:putative ABC transport system permease protein
MRYLYVRLRDGFGADVMEFLERTWKQIAWNQPFDYFFISDRLEQSYSSQERWFSVVSFSSIMAILLACMGICGLTATTVKAQLRALCMRRILGASLTAIVTMIWKRFLKLVLIACLVAWPLGYIVMNRWLEEFPYKAGVGFLSFVLSGVTAVAISCVSVGTQVGYSASANPADVLRVE